MGPTNCKVTETGHPGMLKVGEPFLVQQETRPYLGNEFTADFATQSVGLLVAIGANEPMRS